MFNLAVFFLVNGMPPDLTFDWIKATDVDFLGIFSEGMYKLKERADMQRVQYRWEAGALPLEGKRVFDMYHGRPADAGEYKQGLVPHVGNRLVPKMPHSETWQKEPIVLNEYERDYIRRAENKN